MVLSNFAVFEGGDGSGTSTQLRALEGRLGSKLGKDGAWCCWEPTEGPIGRLIRAALRGEPRLRPETVARLFAADRHEHLFGPGGVVERTAAGRLVVSDRYVLSSLVYQGLDCGEALPEALNRDFPKPELLLYFAVDPETAAARYAGRPVKDVYERLDFQRRVNERYERLLPAYASDGCRLVRIDAGRSIGEVAEQVWSALAEMPILKA
jgi:dTMP kinase